MEKKYIKVAVVEKTINETKTSNFLFYKAKRKFIRIVEQSHRTNKFGENGDTFYSHNGFMLRSCSYPYRMWPSECSSLGGLYVRGSGGSDNQLILIPDEEYLNNVRAAVQEYNRHFDNSAKQSVDENIIEIIE